MIAPTTDCLTAEELSQLFRGEYADERFEAAIEHVEHCDSCQSAADSLPDATPSGLDIEDVSHDPIEPACHVAIGQLLATSIVPTDPLDDFAPSESRLGPYLIVRAIGEGGMGMVYLARHERLKRQCAIKLLPRSRVNTPGWLERFDREMVTVASLEHPNIVRATDAGHQDGWHYLVMEYLDGLDIGQVAARMGRMAQADACQIVKDAACGLAEIHARGLVHRDIKPSNLMLTRRGNTKLLDLGLVLPGDDPLAVDERLTTAGQLMGTMSYMAPEQLLDSRQVDAACDVYALGATLYRLISGHHPHRDGKGMASQILSATQSPPAPLHDAVSEVDEDLSDFVQRMLSRAPDCRPTAKEVETSLTRWTSESDTTVLLNRAERTADKSATKPTPYPIPTETITGPPTGKPPRSYLLGGMAAFGVILAGFLLTLRTEKGELVIESEADNVAINVNQGDQLVEHLVVERGDDNRLTLRKGTYRVEIDGADHGLEMDQNQVTIRGSQSTQVTIRESLPHELSDTDNRVSTKEALRLRPITPTATYTKPQPSTLADCEVRLVKTRDFTGWEVLDPQQRLLRRFLDTTKDKRIDRWCYYKDGAETYRDIDSNGDGKADQYLLMESSGPNEKVNNIHWGIDRNQDGDPEIWIRRSVAVVPDVLAIFRDNVFPALSGSVDLSVNTPEPSPPSSSRLFQGQPYAHWLDLLKREQDANTLADAMNAIEILSTGPAQREEAARACMDLSKNLGGMIIGGTNQQSSQYLESLRSVFPRFLPEPGISVIVDAHQSPNLKSKMAASWILSDFLNGVDASMSGFTPGKGADDFVAALANASPQKRKLLHDLSDALDEVLKQVPATSVENRALRQMSFHSMCKLQVMADGALDASPSLQKEIKEVLAESRRTMNLIQPKSDLMLLRSHSTKWSLAPDLFQFALQMHNKGVLTFPPDLAAAIVAHQSNFGFRRADGTSMFENAIKHVPDSIPFIRGHLRDRIDHMLTGQEMGAFGVPNEGSTAAYYGNTHSDALEAHQKGLMRCWKSAFALLAEDDVAPEASLQALLRLRESVSVEADPSFSGSVAPNEMAEPIDAAIRSLQDRVRDDE